MSDHPNYHYDPGEVLTHAEHRNDYYIVRGPETEEYYMRVWYCRDNGHLSWKQTRYRYDVAPKDTYD